ncbi:MAG: hypothetical protein ACKPEY_15800 [Planctomycetota bacterium]
MRRIKQILIRLALILVPVVLLIVLLVGATVHWASRRVPDFYLAAKRQITQPNESSAAAPLDRLDWEKRFLDWHNDLRQKDTWQLVIKSQELNHWLLQDLPNKFPQALPAEVQEPVVAIDSHGIRLGFHYRDERLDTVLWVECEPFLTRDPREIALQVKRVRAGWLPISPQQVIDQLTRAARLQQLPLRWDQSGGNPVAILRLPERYPQLDNRQITLEAITLAPDQLTVTGHAKP